MKPYCGMVCGVVLLLASISSSPVAQPANGRIGRIPLLIVQKDAPLPNRASFYITRRLADKPGDVVVLSPDASAQQLSDAIRLLLAVRKQDGDLPTSASTMRMREAQTGRRTSRQYAWTHRVLRDLEQASSREVPGVGRGRVVQIWLPRQRNR